MLTEDRITQGLDPTVLSSAKIGWTHLLVRGLQFHSPLLYMSVNNEEKTREFTRVKSNGMVQSVNTYFNT